MTNTIFTVYMGKGCEMPKAALKSFMKKEQLVKKARAAQESGDMVLASELAGQIIKLNRYIKARGYFVKF